MRKTSVLFLFATIFYACVPIKQYKELQATNEECQKTKDSLHEALDSKTIAHTELEGKFAVLQDENQKLLEDTATLKQSNRDLQLDKQGLEGLNEHLIQKQSDISKQNAKEAEVMLSALQKTKEDLLKREDALALLADSLGKEQARLGQLKNELDRKQTEIARRDTVIRSKNKELQELSKLLHTKDSLTHAIRTKVASALLGFEGAGLTIVQRNGKVYISLDESLLFQVGQSKVSEKGIEALKKLAAVLEANEDMKILIEGHTDNTGSPIYNWKLSTERALSITHILLSNSTIAPSRVTAAGRGQFSPIDTADTPEARKKNRRSEIILTPNLDELFDLIKDSEQAKAEAGDEEIHIEVKE